jgi:hypothetical protein
VPLGSDAGFAVLAGSTVTNSGGTIVTGNLGVSPGTAVTGFPPGTLIGALHAADGTAGTAQTDLNTAYGNAAGRAALALGNTGHMVNGQVITPGVYTAPTLSISGAVTLDGGGNPNSVFIFQTPATLITASSASVTLTNRANACNVFWQVGSSATINGVFAGTILAHTSITLVSGASVTGRALAHIGAVTLDTSNVTNTP